MNDDRANDEVQTQSAPVAEAEDTVGETATAIIADSILGDMVEAHSDGSSGKLVVKRNGAETSDQFDLVPPSVIGRFDPDVGPVDVDLGPLPEGIYVSRKHARIVSEDGQWFIEDLGSSNGTFILADGQFERVERAALEDGTEFALGNARFVFRQ